MDHTVLIEIFGYIGSVLVVISMLMSSIVKLRVINVAGSIISGIYAVICGAIPLALMNICLIIINLYNLLKLLKTKKEFELVSCDWQDGTVQHLLTHYAEDIRGHFPAFDKKDAAGKKAYVVCCGDALTGVLMGTEENGEMNIWIDYATPAYRDCSVGKFLYAKLADHLHTLRFDGETTEKHGGYLEKMGFVKQDGIYLNKMKA